MSEINFDCKILAITEINGWEKERWTYILDLYAQDADTVNMLYSFSNLANVRYTEAFSKVKEAAQPIALSRYWVRMYDNVEVRNGNAYLISRKIKGDGLVINIDPATSGYKGNLIDLHAVIYWRKMKKALSTMVKDNDNILYKNFEYLFIK